MKKRKSVELLPVIFRTDANNKFLSGTIDQLIQKPELKKVDGYIGSRITKLFDPSRDSYLNESFSSDFRYSYEVEPGIITKNKVTGEVETAKTFDDILNTLKLFDSPVENQDKLFKQQSYSWTPHIDLDKFINYRNYVWVPTGPQTILITGKEKNIVSTIKVTLDKSRNAWKLSNEIEQENPTLTLYRGFTYIFEIDSPENGFSIRRTRIGQDLEVSEGVSNNNEKSGQVIFEVLETTPSSLFYTSDVDNTIFGKFLVRDQTEITPLDIESDIIGKKEYSLNDNLYLSNGMRVAFSDDVIPEFYRQKTFIVEGVGDYIELIDYESLITIESYAERIESGFDMVGFDDIPFDEVSEYPLNPDYILINRASKDKNPWSRYNRWFHIDVVLKSAEYNKVEPEFDENLRAKRPIIEFRPNIQLYNFTSTVKEYVDFLDDTITDAFSNIEGSLGFYIDGFNLENGNKVVFTKDEDPDVRNKIFEVQFLDVNGTRRLHLEAVNSDPLEENQGLLVLRGNKNGRTSWIFKNNSWQESQRKTSLNQFPLFDIYDDQGHSYGSDKYIDSTFSGSKLFGYQTESGIFDPILGFNIKYSSVNNVGGYLFTDYLSTEIFNYLDISGDRHFLYSKNGYLKFNSPEPHFENSWVKCDKLSLQEIIDQKIAIGGETFIEFDSLDVRTPASSVRVFKNGKLLTINLEYTVSVDVSFDSYFINFVEPLSKNDVILIRALPDYQKLSDGTYETPINLINNPLNQRPTSMSFAEISDHIDSMILNASKSLGQQISRNNLRDQGRLEKYGRRFLQHDGLVSLAGTVLVDKEVNVISSLRWASLEYQKYKRLILQKFIELENYNSISEALDRILLDISKDKIPSTPFYYSDMVPYGANRRIFNYKVKELSRRSYSYGTDVFDSSKLSNQAVLVYLNSELLEVNEDYIFEEGSPSIRLIRNFAVNDDIKIVFFNNTYGVCMPFTPTKLGLYPAFRPKIYLDNSYLEPANVIQGHDGSITVAFNDDRDLLLLELEKRIFNNIKVKYDSRIFDVNDVIPGFFRSNRLDSKNIDKILEEEFLKWTGIFSIDYRTNSNNSDSRFGFNYRESVSSLDQKTVVQGSWRKIYRYFYDTERPHTDPWEMLGFNERPDWWNEVYGEAPYTSGNKILWDDLENGFIYSGDRSGYDERYKRPGLSEIIPVDEYGDLKDPVEIGIFKSFNFAERYNDWIFGDVGPAENAWRKSSQFPFAMQIAMMLMLPAKYSTQCFDISRIKFNDIGHPVYKDTDQRVSPKDLKIFTDRDENGIVLSTGYSTFIVEYLRNRYPNPVERIKNYIQNIESQLVYKIGGFASKDKFKISLETVSNSKTVNQIFIPEENYQIILSVGSPKKTMTMSGIIVERTDKGFLVKGYDRIDPYFKIYRALQSPSDPVISVGGVSESFIFWASNSNVTSGTIVENNGSYYRAISNHITGQSFDFSLYYPLIELPKTGGVEATVAQQFESFETIIPYGTLFKTVQDVFDFIIGYGEYTKKSGFIFDTLVPELAVVADWMLSGKEFMFWSSQKWNNSSVISLAPFSPKVSFSSSDAVVDDVYDSFYEYTLLKSDGTSIDKNKVNILRNDDRFDLDTSKISNDGVYFVKLNLVQKEHIVIFDNYTSFNDLIYEPTSGYRQSRFKVKAVITDGWNGDYYAPGFVYDSAKIEDWQVDVDYSIGDVIKYQTYYYQAKNNLLPTNEFKFEDWERLGKKPVAKLLPNFEYKISQFEDFYSLDSINFDSSQQKFAQKLIGYVPRNYLNSLITDEASQYKFYQGYIKEKGTRAPLEKFSIAHNESLGSHVDLNEEWAIRLGMFGGENTYKEIEFTLDQNKFSQDPQIFEFEFGTQTSSSEKSYVIPVDDVLIKPDNFDGKPWPILNTDISENNSYLQYQKLPTAGYVRLDDVTFTALYENNILTLTDISSLREGDTIWVAMDPNGDWKVKRFTISLAKVITFVVDNENNLIEFTTDVAHGFKLRDFIAVTKIPDPLNTLYEVIGVPTPNTFVVKTQFNDLADAEELLNGILYYFVDTRVSSFKDISKINGLARWKECEFVWADDDGTGNWAVLQKENAAKAIPLRPFTQASNQYFGKTVIISPKSRNVIVSATNVERGRIFVYERGPVGSEQIELKQSYLLEENVSDILTIQNQKNGITVPEMPRNHGQSLDCWESDDLTVRYIVSGAPNSSNAKWIVPGVSTPPIKKELKFNYLSSGIFDEGAIKIVKYNNTEELYVTEEVLASPIAQASAHFGHAVKLLGNTTPFLLVSSPGQNQKEGSVFVFHRVNNVWTVKLETGIPYDIKSEVAELASNSGFGWDIAASSDGRYVAVSAPDFLKDRTQVHSGAVYIFEKDAVELSYTLTQSIYADDYLDPRDLILKGVIKTFDIDDQTLIFNQDLKSLNRSVGNFIQDGFRIGQTINIDGTSSNDGEYVISNLTAQTIFFSESSIIANENVQNNITLTGLGSIRNDRFGDKIAMDQTGSTLIISSDHSLDNKLDSGIIYVLKRSLSGQYQLQQKIGSPSSNAGEMFGSNISLSPDGKTLLVTASGGTQSIPMNFDSYTERFENSLDLYGSEYVLNPASALSNKRTVFDNGSTRFVERPKNTGVVYLFQELGGNFVFGESLLSGDSAEEDEYGSGIDTNGEFCIVGSPKYNLKVLSTLDTNSETPSLITYNDAGTAVVFDKKDEHCGCQGSWSWTKVRYQQDGLVDIDKITKVISYNNSDFSLLDYYEIFDPVKGKLPVKVLEEIKYITPFDPAVYTLSVDTSAKIRVDNKTTWTEEHVGEMWLDTSTLRYVWYEQGSEDFRSNNWGKLFPGATVDVYEWVKSDYRPSDWAALADTPEGLTLGISGLPKNPDNTVVSINQYFDPVINDFVNVYYFWVRNKITVPDLNFRSLSSFECARIIEDPKTQGIKYASFLSPKAVSLTNSRKDLEADKININIYYKDVEEDINRHSHWQIINENERYFNLDNSIQEKLIDSLVGQDSLGNIVPDPTLSPKIRYGTLYNPRQSWFKDREKALKVLISYTNNVLEKYDIVGKVDLTNLQSYELPPLEKFGYYDEIVETDEELSTVGTLNKRQAILQAQIVNGRLIGINIIDAGLGYKIAPVVEIIGDGQGAKVETIIDLSGKITSVRILSQGTGYSFVPNILIRPYAVLVQNDRNTSRWGIYQLEQGQYKRKISQTYDARRYWSYIDWVDPSFDKDIPATYVVRFFSDLDSLDVLIGETVEIRNTGDGRRIILRKTQEGLGNYIAGYDLVFRENSTIRFSDKLFNKSLAGIGFDSTIAFDQNSYDETLSKELRIILNAIRNDVFIKDLSIYWNKFIFNAIRYVLSEQLFVDWVYKTSFIKPIIDAGELNQKNIYRFNDFKYVEEFIKEIKPFKSKIRELTVKHNYTENSDLKVTDFDLPVYLDLNNNYTVPSGELLEQREPFKDWYENYSFSVKEILVSRKGKGYRIPPIVTIIPESGDQGHGAQAFARISNGMLSEIVVTSQGDGYRKTPRVILTGGGNYEDNFEEAIAYPVLSNNKVRNNSVTIKFDRTSEIGLFTGEVVNKNIITDGYSLSYLLTYPVDENDNNYPALQDQDSIKLFLNDSEIGSDNYRIIFRSDLSTLIIFNVALPANQNLRIQYIKNTLYSKDTFVQAQSNFSDTFKLTYPPELDPSKILIKLINPINNTGSEVASSDYKIIVKQEIVGFKKYVGYIEFRNSPSPGTVISVQYAKNINILNAVDRIITKYSPLPNMPGKDVQQLMKGIGFGGVEIQGLNFSVSSGWDGLPWFTQGWDTFVNEFKDLLVISDGVKNNFDLGYVPQSGTKINVYFNGVRVDDENFNTINQTNQSALFNTLIADGVNSEIIIPVVPTANTKIEIRQILSDGVTLPSDDYVLDTNLSGGDFTTIVDGGEVKFRTASGLKADDITVDGGQFLSIEHSPSTEELIKSEIFDALSISVFNSPSSGSNQLETYQFVYDGTVNEFVIDGVPDSSQSLDVYIGDFVLTNSDYSFVINQNKTTTVTLETTGYGLSEATVDNTILITIRKMFIGGDKILGRQVYLVSQADEVSDSISIETAINFNDIGSYYISVSNSNRLEKLSGRSKRAKVVIDNSINKITEGTYITLIVFSSSIKTYSEVYNQEIVIGSSSTYTLDRPPGNIEPLHVMAIVTRITPSNNNWKGNWKENQNYVVDDTVLYKNISYKCKKAHISYTDNSSLDFDSWQNNTSYVYGQGVIYQGNLYYCILAHTSDALVNNPIDGDQYWETLTYNNPGFDEFWEILPKQRLVPVEAEYYEVTSANQVFNLGDNVPYLPRSLTEFDLEVYKNGKKLVVGRDFTFDSRNNTVSLLAGSYQLGDVVAVTVLKNAEFLINNDKITFTRKSDIKVGERIVVTTYTNHDENLMRREVFKGYQTRNEYRLSRSVSSIDNVWADLNGDPLTPNVDYRIFDSNYIKLSEKIEVQDTDRLVVTSISNLNSGSSIGYRIFKDMTNSYQYKRLASKSSTALTSPLFPTDRIIAVEDASIFGAVLPTNKNPGVLFIAGERIEFRKIEGNTISNITRGTLGTGVAKEYGEGTRVFNSDQSSTIPYKEGLVLNTFKTPEGYRYNQETEIYEELVNNTYVPAEDLGVYVLENMNFKEGIAYEDQVSVYIGNRVLMKPAKPGNKLVKHDFSITLFSDEVNSLGETGEIELDPDFTISKINDSYVLSINEGSLLRDENSSIIPNVQIKVVQKVGKIWYTLNGNQTLQQDSTVQAKFLQEFAADLPDKYYYAQPDVPRVYIKDENGENILDETGKPMELE
jgi:hypothetical protein